MTKQINTTTWQQRIRSYSRHPGSLILFLLVCLAALITAAVGLAFLLWQADTTPTLYYLLRIAVAALSAFLFQTAMQRRDPVVKRKDIPLRSCRAPRVSTTADARFFSRPFY